MSKSKVKAPFLFIDTVHKGCFVDEQQIFKTPDVASNDVIETDYFHHYDRKTASDFNKWPRDSNDENEGC